MGNHAGEAQLFVATVGVFVAIHLTLSGRAGAFKARITGRCHPTLSGWQPKTMDATCRYHEVAG